MDEENLGEGEHAEGHGYAEGARCVAERLRPWTLAVDPPGLASLFRSGTSLTPRAARLGDPQPGSLRFSGDS